MNLIRPVLAAFSLVALISESAAVAGAATPATPLPAPVTHLSLAEAIVRARQIRLGFHPPQLQRRLLASRGVRGVSQMPPGPHFSLIGGGLVPSDEYLLQSPLAAGAHYSIGKLAGVGSPTISSVTIDGQSANASSPGATPLSAAGGDTITIEGSHLATVNGLAVSVPYVVADFGECATLPFNVVAFDPGGTWISLASIPSLPASPFIVDHLVQLGSLTVHVDNTTIADGTISAPFPVAMTAALDTVTLSATDLAGSLDTDSGANAANLSAANASFAAVPGLSGPTNWGDTYASGTDAFGTGVNVLNAYTATATVALVNEPDYNDSGAYQGGSTATLASSPTATLLATGVNWSIGPYAYIGYTVTWSMVGPHGLRPISTLPTTGNCNGA